jgi:pyridinium-3,5-biscarboxylic acid mononucleotide sulfurtransferase
MERWKREGREERGEREEREERRKDGRTERNRGNLVSHPRSPRSSRSALPPYRLSAYVSRMPDLEKLYVQLRSVGSAVLGYSGGVDSALLAVAATRALGPERFLAVMGRSASYPAVQAENAVRLAQQFHIPLLEVDTQELNDPRYLENTTERCYFCKSELWRCLEVVAREGGYDVILDGTNSDDLGEHRPGLRATKEYRVCSPLAELGWGKSQVRAAARELGLPTWDAPAAPCLSSRVLYGLEITSERLRQVEQGEAFLRELGVTGDLRVRHYGAKARLEVAPEQMDRLRANWSSIDAAFGSFGFDQVELDPAGYRRGGLLVIAPLARD